jgi:uncharacterized protein YbaP (TraB family)
VKKIGQFFLVVFLLLGLVACNPQSQQTESQNEQDTSPTPTTKVGSHGFLWKTSHGNTTVYMVGSIHVANEDFYPLDPDIESAFAESDTLVVEADVVNINQAKIMKLLEARGKYNDGTTLKDHLSQDLYNKLEETLKTFKLKASIFETYEPWYVAMMIDSLHTLKMGYNPELGIDYHFLEKATEKKMEIIQLEGAAYQLHLFDQFAPEIQVKVLESSLESVDHPEELNELVQFWKEGDLKGLERLTYSNEDQSKEYKIYTDVLLNKRNVRMVDKIEKLLKSGENKEYFVIVGAAHFIGEQGIVKLLQDKGYIVERIE